MGWEGEIATVPQKSGPQNWLMSLSSVSVGVGGVLSSAVHTGGHLKKKKNCLELN